MGTRPGRESATIHRFPLGGRAALQRRATAQAMPPTPRFGGGWYHEQAIKDASDERTPPPRL